MNILVYPETETNEAGAEVPSGFFIACTVGPATCCRHASAAEAVWNKIRWLQLHQPFSRVVQDPEPELSEYEKAMAQANPEMVQPSVPTSHVESVDPLAAYPRSGPEVQAAFDSGSPWSAPGVVVPEGWSVRSAEKL